MNFTPTWIISVVLFIACFFAIIFIAKFLTKTFENISFSFMRVFPFEVPLHQEKTESIYRTITYLFGAMSFTPIFSLMGNDGVLSNFRTFSILICCLFGLAGICFIFLHVFDVTHVKVHLTIFGLFGCLILLGSALTCVKGLLEYKTMLDHAEKIPVLLISGVFAGIFALLTLCLLLNPKLMVWAKLDKVEGEVETYVRPKKFPLAYTEWGLFLLMFLSESMMFLELLVK